MKHVFYIQSNITYLIALSIIRENKIDLSSVRLLVRTHYTLPQNDFKIYEFEKDFRSSLNDKSIFKRFLSEDALYENFDKKINDFVDDDQYILYLPNIYTSERQSFINHKLCTQVNFIEEGLMVYSFTDSYKPDFYKNLKGLKKITSFVSRKLFSMRRRRQFTPKHFFDISVLRNKEKTIFYGVSKKSFEKYKPQNLQVIDLSPFDKNLILPDKTNVIVLDTLAENKLVDFEVFLSSVFKIINSLKGTTYIKFHPLQNENTIEKILSYCNENHINLSIIAKEVFIEDFIINSKDLLFHGHISSLLFYAKELGNHTSITYIDHFENDEKFSKYIKTQDIDILKVLNSN